MTLNSKNNVDAESEKSFFLFFKDNISLILIGLYTFSFVNFYIYYKGFEISIFNYVGLNDLAFFSIENIFKVILLVFILEVTAMIFFTLLFNFYRKWVLFFIKKKGLFYLKLNKNQKERIDDVFMKYFYEYFSSFKILLFFASLFVIPLFKHLLITIPALLIHFLVTIHKSANQKFTKLFLLFPIGIIALATLATTLVDSYYKRFRKDDFIISFNEDSKHYSTDAQLGCLNYLGETSTNIFLYDIEKKQAMIFHKEKISDIKIKNQNTIDDIILKLEKTEFIKFLFNQ